MGNHAKWGTFYVDVVVGIVVTLICNSLEMAPNLRTDSLMVLHLTPEVLTTTKPIWTSAA